MNDIGTIVGIAVGVLSIVGGYTTLIYKIGSLTAQINRNSELILQVHNVVVNQDDKINDLENRLIKLETAHTINHGGTQ